MDDAIARSYGMTSHPSLRFGHDDLMLDDDTVDRLLDGLAPDDAPPGYAWVARAFATLRVPDRTDPDAEDFAVALFRAARDEVEVLDEPGPVVVVEEPASDVGPEPEDRAAAVGARRLTLAGGRARRLSVAAGAVAALSLVSATSAAAMTGALPAPAQRAAHAVMSVVGVHVPGPAPRPVLSGRPTVPLTVASTSPSSAPPHGASSTAPVANPVAPWPWRHHGPVNPTTGPTAPVAVPSPGTKGHGHPGAGNDQGSAPAVSSSPGHGHGHGHGGQAGGQGDQGGQGGLGGG